MKNIRFITAIGFLFAFGLAACKGEIPSTDNATLTIPQTIEVTQTIQQSAPTPESNPTIAATELSISSTSINLKVGSSSVDMDPAYFDGIIVLTQYYTLLDHGLYEEVLGLYSSSLLTRSGGNNFEADLKSVKIRFIRPYNYWLAQQGLPPLLIPENEIRFIVGTTVLHKGAAWNLGGTTTPDSQTRFISLVLENGKWKLNEFNSSPWSQ